MYIYIYICYHYFDNCYYHSFITITIINTVIVITIIITIIIIITILIMIIIIATMNIIMYLFVYVKKRTFPKECGPL